ncbi:MAG: DUF3175 domain-containing protein [Geminicoccaceae bacterium]
MPVGIRPPPFLMIPFPTRTVSQAALNSRYASLSPPCARERPPNLLVELGQSRGPALAKRKDQEKWSGEVTEHSDALDLQPHIFESGDPKAIARSLNRSAEASRPRKAEPFRSAMSTLTFYINRAGKNLDASHRQVLEAAKNELRTAFGREPR